MGANSSDPTFVPYLSTNMFANDAYFPIAHENMKKHMGVSSSCKHVYRQAMNSSPFAGTLSSVLASSNGPCPRTGHFHFYDERTQTAYVGYGLSANETPLFDLWALNCVTFHWRHIPLFGEPLAPRTGAQCAFIGTHLVIFGGYAEGVYYNDLHTIDVETGEVCLVQTVGEPPSPRANAMVTIYKQKLFVWGGFDGHAWPNKLHCLDFATMSWESKKQKVHGRAAIPYVTIGNTLYAFGGAKTGGLLVINLDKGVVSTRRTHGSEPPPQPVGGGMVVVDKYLVYFGGRARSATTLMYACDTERNWWFVFHVKPDGESVSTLDGNVTEKGLFMMPRLHSFGVCYVKETRKIVAFLGSPMRHPSPLSVVSVGDAMGALHLREDMLHMLSIGRK